MSLPPPAPPHDPPPALWDEIESAARAAGLDPAKFNQTHRQIVAQIVAFLHTEPAPAPAAPEAANGWERLARRVSLLAGRDDAAGVAAEPVPPLIICGEPGTGKTTFLYVLDGVLRRFHLPDAITPVMHKDNGRSLRLTKRAFNGRTVSLLSVRKWSELLHFYAWDSESHSLQPAAQTRFIQTALRPMRLLFADEVEMTGYSPTIPDLARQGLLVVGTSNQTRFVQLEAHGVPARIYHFGGVDMRAGNPEDALVTQADPAWRLFVQAAKRPSYTHDLFTYQWQRLPQALLLRLAFPRAMRAPLLEREWTHFLQAAYETAVGASFQVGAPLILLLDSFSLDFLRTDYNAIIRLVSLLDVVEQFGLGLLVRHPDHPIALSREAFTHMKVTIQSARGVTEEIKQRTVVGIDRSTSRLGQAGHTAREWLARRSDDCR